ncbi:MAG: LysE family translocator [Pseudomonadota bacterium]|nr:LysE family translocator [Pseudomonadota bacterium]
MLALFAVLLVLAIAPGTTDLAVVAHAAGAGLPRGLWMVGGIVLAEMLLVLIAAASLALAAEGAGVPLPWLRYPAAACLLWFGLRLWRASPRQPAQAPGLPAALAGAGSFGAGLLLTLGDPKALLFYLGLVPVFLVPEALTGSDILLLMAGAGAIIAVVKSGYALAAHRARLWFADAAVRRRLDRVAGSVLVLTAGWLLLR